MPNMKSLSLSDGSKVTCMTKVKVFGYSFDNIVTDRQAKNLIPMNSILTA